MFAFLIERINAVIVFNQRTARTEATWRVKVPNFFKGPYTFGQPELRMSSGTVVDTPLGCPDNKNITDTISSSAL